MSLATRIALAVVGWLAAITLLHLWLNTSVFDGPRAGSGGRLRVGFLPVT
jgi:hypothetical protein